MSKAIFRFCAIAGLVLGSVAALSAQPRVVSKFGAARVAGRDVIVHMWVVVPPGLDENEVALEALRGQGARPFQGDEFSTTGLVWDVFSDGIPGNDIVTEYYNSQNDPTSGGAGLQALLNKQATWTNEPTSSFAFFFGGSTTRCPSLVQECPGAQAFDGNNDVGWLALGGCCTLAVAWYGTSIDEADIALNTNFPWATDGVNHYDVETVMLHETATFWAWDTPMSLVRSCSRVMAVYAKACTKTTSMASASYIRVPRDASVPKPASAPTRTITIATAPSTVATLTAAIAGTTWPKTVSSAMGRIWWARRARAWATRAGRWVVTPPAMASSLRAAPRAPLRRPVAPTVSTTTAEAERTAAIPTATAISPARRVASLVNRAIPAVQTEIAARTSARARAAKRPARVISRVRPPLEARRVAQAA